MPERLVINTTPILSIIASQGSLDLLGKLYGKVVVPMEVAEEVLSGGRSRFGVTEFEKATFLDVRMAAVKIPPLLAGQLDRGEAAVIHTAIAEGLDTVCIDETVGRRIARLSGLKVTGSMGILLRAKRDGHPIYISDSIRRMRGHGIWVSLDVEREVLRLAGEAE